MTPADGTPADGTTDAGTVPTHGRHRRPAPSRRTQLVRAWSALAVALVAVLVLALANGRGSDDAGGGDPAQRSGMQYGVLGGSCDPERLDALRAAGVTVVEFDMGWDRYEPAPGRFDEDYLTELREKFEACRDAGMDLILSLGLQSPPGWALQLDGGRLLDQTGNAPSSGGLDLVFDGEVRQAVGTYLERIAQDLGFDGVAAVRLGTNVGGELGYPGPGEGSDPAGHAYWAFNAAAQRGTGLADGMAASPLPGWVPGTPTWRGVEVDVDQVADWFSWYSRSLVDAVGWQADELRNLGFTGDLHVPVAGSGAFPSDLRAAIAGRLDGRNDPMGALERGLDYPTQFAALAELDRRLRETDPDAGIVVDFTGLDDVTAVLARRSTPPQDGCFPADADAVAAGGEGVENWSGQRFTIATARAHGLAVIGENPGPPHAPMTGGSPDSDSLAAQLDHATAYARECELETFLFAFERDLFDPSSGVPLDDYAREIEGL